MTENKKDVLRRHVSYHKNRTSRKYSCIQAKESRSNEVIERQLSDTLLKLKEKITPKCAKIKEKTPTLSRQSSYKTQTKAVSAFDEWVKKKNEELKLMQQKYTRKKRLSKSSTIKKTYEEMCDEKSLFEFKDKEVKGPEIKGRLGMTDMKMKRGEGIPSGWNEIKRSAAAKQKTIPMNLGRVSGHTMRENPYLTKYVMKPDPAFQARYRSVLNEAKSRPPEIILDAEWNYEKDDPARLPAKYRNILRSKPET